MATRCSASWWIGAGLFAATLALWWPATRNGFVNLDDDVYVTENLRVLSGLCWNGVRWAFELSHPGVRFYWHPLTWLSLMADRQLFGPGPFGFHFVNVFLHAANAALVFALLRSLTGAAGRSAIVAALFAVHPLQVESVAWVVERKTVLGAFFGLIATLAYVGYARRASRFRYAGALLPFALSLTAKPMLVTLPLLLLGLDVWPLGRLAAPEPRGWARLAPGALRLVVEKLPFLLASVAVMLLVWLSQRGIPSDAAPGLPLRLSNAAVSVWRYVGTAVWPADLALFHPFPSSVPLAPALLAAAALALVTLAFARLWRRVPAVLAGWLWFLVTLLPVLGLVQAGLWPAMADRFAYLPLVGLAVAIVWGAAAAARLVPRARVAGVLVCATALVLFAARTRRQIEVWGDSVTLLETAVAAAPQAAALRANLAGTYLRNGEIEKAIAGYRDALRLDPRHTVAYVGLARAYATSGRPGPARDTLEALGRARPGPTAHVELGNLALAAGQLDGAAREYAAAVALDPGHAGARFNLAQVLQRQSRTDAARRELRAVLELDSSFRAAHLALADLELAAGDREAALRSLEDARRLGLPDASLLLRLGTAYGEAGRIDRAVARLQEAVGLEPASSEAHNNLGTAYWLSGSLDAAAREYELATRLEPANARAHFNLSLAYRRQGRVGEADAALRRAVRLDSSFVGSAVPQTLPGR